MIIFTLQAHKPKKKGLSLCLAETKVIKHGVVTLSICHYDGITGSYERMIIRSHAHSHKTGISNRKDGLFFCLAEARLANWGDRPEMVLVFVPLVEVALGRLLLGTGWTPTH